MFRPSYLKEGPGIAKDAPEKTGAAWVGETFVREFWQLVKLNVLFLLCCLPVSPIQNQTLTQQPYLGQEPKD